jgi:hypothetical protein
MDCERRQGRIAQCPVGPHLECAGPSCHVGILFPWSALILRLARMLGCGLLTGRDHPFVSLILGAVNVAKMSLRTYHLNLKLWSLVQE